mmetsp:Transcript_58741/g.124565  ORF Transcript_58741/g.124565 Transcript_58741/m.124565 type:complete len:249 (+) Transcript_58741:756-1502(+)
MEVHADCDPLGHSFRDELGDLCRAEEEAPEDLTHHVELKVHRGCAQARQHVPFGVEVRLLDEAVVLVEEGSLQAQMVGAEPHFLRRDELWERVPNLHMHNHLVEGWHDRVERHHIASDAAQEVKWLWSKVEIHRQSAGDLLQERRSTRSISKRHQERCATRSGRLDALLRPDVLRDEGLHRRKVLGGLHNGHGPDWEVGLWLQNHRCIHVEVAHPISRSIPSVVDVHLEAVFQDHCKRAGVEDLCSGS